MLLIEKQILLEPSVSVVVKQFNSKRVDVQGEVKKPDAYPVEPGMTLLGIISRAGGLTSLAEDDIVVRRRDKKTGRVVTSTVSYSAIRANEIPDVPLQAGDTIFVDQRVF
jgi:polysaccharide export outer membrane protein